MYDLLTFPRSEPKVTTSKSRTYSPKSVCMIIRHCTISGAHALWHRYKNTLSSIPSCPLDVFLMALSADACETDARHGLSRTVVEVLSNVELPLDGSETLDRNSWTYSDVLWIERYQETDPRPILPRAPFPGAGPLGRLALRGKTWVVSWGVQTVLFVYRRLEAGTKSTLPRRCPSLCCLRVMSVPPINLCRTYAAPPLRPHPTSLRYM